MIESVGPNDLRNAVRRFEALELTETESVGDTYRKNGSHTFDPATCEQVLEELDDIQTYSDHTIFERLKEVQYTGYESDQTDAFPE